LRASYAKIFLLLCEQTFIDRSSQNLPTFDSLSKLWPLTQRVILGLPFVGQWKANATKSRPRLSKKEASYERTISREGDYLVFASSGGVSKAAIRQFKIRCDSLLHPLPTGPVLSCGYTAPNRVDGETKDPNQSNLFWTREVSPDGQEMTISEYKDKARSKETPVI
jgi:hypothetical protein